MISVLLPSRGRPESLSRAVRSLAHGEVEIIVGLDIDDPTANEAEAGISDLPQVRAVRMERKPTPADMFNELQAQAQGDWYLPFPDDYVVDQARWAEIVQHALDRQPLGVVYLWDRCYPYFATFPMVSRALVEAQGFYMPPFFPFLYGDTWWNEIGAMSTFMEPAKASVTICGEKGNDHHYRDLRVWSRMFEATRPLREELAIKIIQERTKGNDGLRDVLLSTLPERSQTCRDLQAPSQTDDWCERWDAYSDKYANPHYSDLKQKAERFLEQAWNSSSSSPLPLSITA